MNGKRAKQLRRVSERIANGQGFPDLEYDEKVSTSIRYINTPAGRLPLRVKTVVKQLHNCKRKIYKDLKKMYKSGVPIFD